MKLTNKDVVLFIGDSITHGGRLESMDLNHIMGHGFSEMVASRLAADNRKEMPKFINKGISGNNSGSILGRWQTDCLDYAPTIVSLLCGVNDICFPGEGDTDKTALLNIEKILQRTFEAIPNVKFILCEPFYLDVRNQEKPYEDIPHVKSESDFVYANNVIDEEKIAKFKERMSRLQNALPALAEKYGAIYVPFQDVYDSASKETPASYFIWDNVHPTMVGHRLMADRWLEVVEKHIM